MNKDPVVQELIDKTFRELAQANQPKQNSRNWQDPEGYRYLFPWSNAVLLRFLIRKFTESLPKKEFRRKTQFDDAGRSTVRNIEEGFKRATTKEYLEFLSFSQGSLEEIKGDTRESAEDGFLKSVPGSSLAKLGISLKDFNLALRKPRQLKDGKGPLKEIKGRLRENGENVVTPYLTSSSLSSKPSSTPLEDQFVYRDITALYPPLGKIKAEDLTYEIFMELVNKTDYLLRSLVVSLENKLNTDRKFYQVEQAKIKAKIRGE